MNKGLIRLHNGKLVFAQPLQRPLRFHYMKHWIEKNSESGSELMFRFQANKKNIGLSNCQPYTVQSLKTN